MQKQEGVCILIDGANFYHLALKKLGISELDFDFEKFAEFLVNDRKTIEKGKRFYTGTIREKRNDPKSRRAMAKQTKLFTYLSFNGWEIKTSKLRTRTEKIIIDKRVINYQDLLGKGIKEIIFQRTREKGIDVKMATDLIVGALDNKYGTAILVSSDTDLTPAIDWIRKRLNRKVEYIGFSIPNTDLPEKSVKPSQGMITYSDIQRILVASDIRKFVKP